MSDLTDSGHESRSDLEAEIKRLRQDQRVIEGYKGQLRQARDELRLANDVPNGNAIDMGDVEISWSSEDGTHTIKKCIVIQFDSDDDIRAAMDARACRFDVMRAKADPA